MTENPAEEIKQKVSICKVKGKQTKSGYNKIEADYIIDRVNTIISKQREMPSKLANSIGIISPFRNQVDYIAKRVAKEFSIGEIKEHKIMVGTPFSFQGSERDIVYISLVCDNASIKKTKTYLNRSNEFNVAITRAKNHQYLYKSFDVNYLPPSHILRQYIEEPYVVNLVSKKEIVYRDKFANEVAEEFLKIGLSNSISFEIGGLDIDIVIWKENRYLAIDLIGYPGSFEKAFTLKKYHHYKEVGIPIFPLSFTAWKFSKEKCINKVLEILSMTQS